MARRPNTPQPKPPAMQLYVRDWLASTVGMPLDVKGLHIDLLCIAWDNGRCQTTRNGVSGWPASRRARPRRSGRSLRIVGKKRERAGLTPGRNASGARSTRTRAHAQHAAGMRWASPEHDSGMPSGINRASNGHASGMASGMRRASSRHMPKRSSSSSSSISSSSDQHTGRRAAGYSTDVQNVRRDCRPRAEADRGSRPGRRSAGRRTQTSVRQRRPSRTT